MNDENESKNVINLQSVNKTYPSTSGFEHIKRKILNKDKQIGFTALEDICFSVNSGDIVGLIGRNGAGKSTLLKIISEVLVPTSGKVRVNGRVISLLELGSGFDYDFTGIENIYMYGSIMGLRKESVDQLLDSIIKFADIGEYIHMPIRTYSSGMVMRLAFSVATQINGDIFIIDEALAVGDEEFSEKSFRRMMEIRESGMTVLFCSHSLYQIEVLCNRVIVLEGGRISFDGNPSDAVAHYKSIVMSNEKQKENIVCDDLCETPVAKIKINEVNLILNDEYVHGNFQVKSKKDEIKIEVKVSSLSSEIIYSLGISISDESGRIVTSMGAHNDGVKLTCKNFKDRVILSIGKCPLLKGNYFLNVNVFCKDGIFKYDSVLECIKISVSQDCLTQGIVSIPHTWN